MTPLLWMQYAHDAGLVLDLLNQEGSIDIICQILELGLAEFPGCAVLRLYHLDCVLVKCDRNIDGSDDSESDDDVKNAWENIINSVCLGCHGGCDEPIVVALFKLYTQYLLKKKPSEVGQIFLKRGELFMKNGNDTLCSEIILTLEKFNVFTFTESHFNMLESKRQIASQQFSFLSNLEDDVLIAMGVDGISSPPDLNSFVVEEDETKSNTGQLRRIHTLYDWGKILKAMEKGSTYLMGCGMMHTSTSFIKYARAVMQQIKHVRKILKKAYTSNENVELPNDHEHQQAKHLLQILIKMIIQIFERGVSECPTVEIIWEKYIKHLFFILHEASDGEDALGISQTLDNVKSVAARAVRNCPYSVKLFSLKMSVIQEEVHFGRKVLDPDELISIVNQAVEGKFLPSPESNLEVYTAAFMVIKEKILDLISKATSKMAFDEAEQIYFKRNKKRKRGEFCPSTFDLYDNLLDEDVNQEVRDLIEDLRELYDVAETFFQNTFKESTDLIEKVLRERANVEAYICMPILADSNYLEDAIEHYEKMLRIHQLPHPDSWRCYIKFVMGSNLWDKIKNQKNPQETDLLTGGVAAKFRFARSLYHRSMKSTKKEVQQKKQVYDTEYIVSMRLLCDEFKAFENNFGSSKSKAIAQRMVEGKLALFNISPFQETAHSDQLLDNSNSKTVSKVEHVVNKPKKDEKLTVWIGKLQYPVHPFTIHVSNLSPLTEDMDLYDLFHSKCGAIVHCRIFREKGSRDHSQRPDSKCTGLIQFEERESVEEALKLNGEVGLHEKLIKISRSHQPAVAIVPPGMHRVQPKGQGKSTKANEKRKERRKKKRELSNEEKLGDEYLREGAVPSTNHKQDGESKKSILSFCPRGVVQKRRKTKIAFAQESK